MTTKPKAHKFRIRRRSAPTTEPTDVGASPLDGAGAEDGFGDMAFPGSAKAEQADGTDPQSIVDIRREGLTGRQLRMARRLAQKHGMSPSSDFDAVRLLRSQGIDPFDRANMIELVHARGQEKPAEAPAAAAKPAPDAKPKAGLPQKVETRPTQLPGPVSDSGPLHLHDVERIQRDILKRRRRKVGFLVARLTAFVLLPTLISFYYFAFVATPSYATKSEFIVQQAETTTMSAGLLGGTSLATSQDSIVVQDFLMSREAMLLLDSDHGYRAHFSDPSIDMLQRVEDGASNEALYKHYKNNVSIGYDPTEGVIRMEVSAMSPEMSQVFSEALIGYAEDRVDRGTERKRATQMRDARSTFDEAETKMVQAQERVLALQGQLGVLDPATETAGLMNQINTFEIQLSEKRLQLQQLLDNNRPNQARVAGVEGDIARLEEIIAEFRAQLTVEGTGASMASMTAQLSMAEVDLETRTMMMQEALQQLEAARIEANRQVRFLSVGVSPVPPDEATYPKVFENTLVALLIFAGIYLLISVTVAVLREQVSN